MNKLDLQEPEKIKSSTNRHRLSTLIASFDISKSERDMFYEHMGHSKEINQHIYQAPPGIMEILKVGKHILNIDKG